MGRPSRPAARLLLAVWLVAAFAPAVGAAHAFGDDPACENPAFSPHPVAQVEGVLPPVHHDHCDVCHFQRTLRGAAPAGSTLPAAATTSGAAWISFDRAPRPADASALPPRAPPSL